MTGQLEDIAPTGHLEDIALTGHLEDIALTGHLEDIALTGHLGDIAPTGQTSVAVKRLKRPAFHFTAGEERGADGSTLACRPSRLVWRCGCCGGRAVFPSITCLSGRYHLHIAGPIDPLMN